MTRAWAALVLGLTLAAAGCQGPGVAHDELPEDPIAFVFHPEEEARLRAQARAQRAAAAGAGRLAPSSVIHLNRFRDYLTRRFESPDEADFPGRLALLDPRSRRVTVVESARRGAIPLAWSPERDRLLFAQWDLGRLQLFEFERGSRVVSQLTRGPDQHPQGCFGPRGRLIVVVATRAEPAEGRGGARALVSRIAALGPGDARESLSPGPLDGEPACSANGSAIAYVRLLPGGGGEIWVDSFADAAPARAIARGREPAFSPDGEWIVYSRAVGKTPALWRIRRDGSGRARLGRGAGADEHGPAVSPDGSLVVYESVLDNRHRLFVRRFDGSGDRVLFSDGDGAHAVW